MVMLSNFLRFNLTADTQRPMRLADLAIDAREDHPPVTHLIVRESRQRLMAVPWNAVAAIDWHAAQIRLTDLDAAEPLSSESLQRALLLKRDLLDSMILDLMNRTTALAHDLWLEQEQQQLRLCGADVSVWAIARRLSRKFIGSRSRRHLLDWKDVEYLHGDPQIAREGGDPQRHIAELSRAGIAQLITMLPYLHATELLLLLPTPLATDVLEVMSPERQVQVFEEFTEEEALRFLTHMAPDIAADLLGRLQPATAARYLKRLPEKASRRLVDLLRYSNDVAGGIMTNDMPVVPIDLTVEQAREALRDQLKEADFVYYIYVVDDERTQRLRGIMTVRHLLMADHDQPVTEIMRLNLVTIDPLESAKVAAQRVVDNQLAALPVVRKDGRLLGAITADAAVAQIAPQSWRAQAPRVFS